VRESQRRQPARRVGLRDRFGIAGNPLGIEITAPSRLSLEALNRILENLSLSPLTSADLAPLQAA
jgi:hypothetical protein